MLGRWPIRVKLLVGLALLVLLVGVLSSSGLYAIYAYRSLVKDLSWRADEWPLSTRLNQRVAELRATVDELSGLRAAGCGVDAASAPVRLRMAWEEFRTRLDEVGRALDAYRNQLEHKLRAGSPIADDQPEWATVHRLETVLERIRQWEQRQQWVLAEGQLETLHGELTQLQGLAAELPSHLHRKIRGLTDGVRYRYRVLIVGMWVTSAASALIFGMFLRLSYQWVFRPLGVLIAGSRRVAAGEFGHRIHLDTRDEMAELGEAMNQMTARFQAIRDDLDRQVQERTKQVVRSEQLASVGFLAAGVAHEINNPLASIAMCAESLVGRLAGVLDSSHPDHDVIRHYLQMIQSEAFRCKEITEKLLDFSRIGQSQRQRIDLVALVQGVVEMVGHLGKYQRKRLELQAAGPVIVAVNPQEIKQVMLNLLTNALDSVEDGGWVRVVIARGDEGAEVEVIDNGCGMTPEVLEHVFEPFFTRRRQGQGTGLGLSISYRIVSDHGGTITAESAGPGRGATFRVRLPLAEGKEATYRAHAA